MEECIELLPVATLIGKCIERPTFFLHIRVTTVLIVHDD